MMKKKTVLKIMTVILSCFAFSSAVSGNEVYINFEGEDTCVENILLDPTLKTWKNKMLELSKTPFRVYNLKQNNGCSLEFDICFEEKAKPVIEEYMRVNRINTISNRLFCTESPNFENSKEMLAVQYSSSSDKITLFVSSDAAAKRSEASLLDFGKKYHIKYTKASESGYVDFSVDGERRLCADKFNFTYPAKECNFVFYNPFSASGAGMLLDNVKVKSFDDDNGLFIRRGSLENGFKGVDINISPTFVFNHRIDPFKVCCTLNGDGGNIKELKLNGNELTVFFKRPLEYGNYYSLSFEGTADIYGYEFSGAPIKFTSSSGIYLVSERLEDKGGQTVFNLSAGDEFTYKAEYLNKTEKNAAADYIIVLYDGSKISQLFAGKIMILPGERAEYSKKIKTKNEPGKYTFKAFYFKELENLTGIY